MAAVQQVLREFNFYDLGGDGGATVWAELAKLTTTDGAWSTREQFYAAYPKLSLLLHGHCFAKPVSSLCAELTVGAAQRCHRPNMSDHQWEQHLMTEQNVLFPGRERVRREARARKAETLKNPKLKNENPKAEK